MKGKHAARSVKRANEAAVAHIDRLTDKLTEAKIIARQNQGAARELPASRQELDRLRKQLIAGTSDALDRERSTRRAERVEFEERIHHIGRLFGEIASQNGFGLSHEQWGELRDLLGPLDEYIPEFRRTRTMRRNAHMAGSRLTGFQRAVAELPEGYA